MRLLKNPYSLLLILSSLLLFLTLATPKYPSLNVSAENKTELSFQNAMIEDLFHTLETLLDITILPHPSISGRVSVHLDLSSSKTALTTIVEKLGFKLLEENDTFYIAPPGQLQEIQKEEERREIPLNYTPAEKIQSLISIHLPNLEQRVQRESNTLILKGTPSDLQRARTIIDRLDDERYIEQDFLYYPILFGDGERILPHLSSSLPDLSIELDQQSYSLILRGLPQDLKKAENLLLDLDRKLTEEREVMSPIKKDLDNEKLLSILTRIFPSLHVHTYDKENIHFSGQREKIEEALHLFSLLEAKLLAHEEVHLYSLDYVKPEVILSLLSQLPSHLLPEIEPYCHHLILSGSSDLLAQTLPVLKHLDDPQDKGILYTKIKEIEASKMAELLENLLPSLTIQLDRTRNTLLLIDSEEELKRAESIIARGDREIEDHSEVGLFSLQHMHASQMSSFILEITPRLTITQARNNLLLLQGSPDEIAEASEWIEELDKEDYIDRELKSLSLQEDHRRNISILLSFIPGLEVRKMEDTLIVIGRPQQIDKAEEWLKWLEEEQEKHGDFSIVDPRLEMQEVPFSLTGIIIRGRESIAMITHGESSYFLQMGDALEDLILLKIHQEIVLLLDDSDQVFILSL